MERTQEDNQVKQVNSLGEITELETNATNYSDVCTSGKDAWRVVV
jgi:hypothetical protein